MQQLTISGFLQQEETYHGAVAACSGIDPYCTRLDWILPFHSAFTPKSPLHIWQDRDSFVVLSRGRGPQGLQLYSSVDSLWGFASALVGSDSASMLGSACRGDLRRGHILLYGLPDDRAFIEAVAGKTAATHRAFMLDPVTRCVASLAGGLEGFLSRRTRKFRVNARRMLKRAGEAGLAFTYSDQLTLERLAAVYRTVLDIECRSWKGLKDEGADKPPMREFYRCMFQRIVPAGWLRLIVAELDGRPIGYIHGACIGARFRGLQFSFDDRYRSLSLGNVLQLKMLEWLAREQVTCYDLGMCVPYKRAWAELEHNTLTLYLRPL